MDVREMAKINIQLLQINSSYGNQYFIPYSVGLLQSFSNEFNEIKENFNFKKLIYKQETDLNKQVKELGEVNIFGQSCYVWNYQFNLAFAKLAKEHNPESLIVLGGPQVPDNSKGFFDKYPFVDILCHGEGEIVFYEILKRYVEKRDYSSIEGVSYNDKINKKTIQTLRAKVSIDLEKMPSPYLDGTFSNLLEENVAWQASWETNRGCPYRCSFCVWGAEYYNKIRKFNFEDRLLKEIDWFSNNKIELVFGCDANFGIFPRDLDIAKALVANKEKYGFPKKFRVCNAKNSNQLVYDISETLNKAGMDKGTSMSVQSMNPEVLSAIKRSNIGLDKFKDLLSKFNKSSIPTYTEIILPLPKE
ncbi:MAG: radical SAM protein, partial [Nanoarchaeota archaeon]